MQASGTSIPEFSTQFYLCLKCLTICSEFSVFLKLSSVLPSQMSHLLSHSVFSVPRSHFSDTVIICAVITPHAHPLGWIREPPKRRACPGVRHRWSQVQALSFSTFTPASEVCLQLTGGGTDFHTLVLLASTLSPLITMLCLMS